MKHCFYYDESEHSRIINLSTILARRTMMVFWRQLSGGAAIMKLHLSRVIMLLKKNTLTERKMGS